MNNAEQIMDELVEVVRDLTQAKRYANLERIKNVAKLLGLDPDQFNYLRHNVARWPDRVRRNSTELRYMVDFGHGDQPDYVTYLATFDEVCRLLRYTPGSCKVAFTTSPTHSVDRTKRPTKLGPCIVSRLDEPVELKDAIGAQPLSVREQLFVKATNSATPHARGKKY